MNFKALRQITRFEYLFFFNNPLHRGALSSSSFLRQYKESMTCREGVNKNLYRPGKVLEKKLICPGRNENCFTQ